MRSGFASNRGQRCKILDRERIDTAQVRAAAHLDQREFGVIGAFADELGIDGAGFGRIEPAHKLGQRRSSSMYW